MAGPFRPDALIFDAEGVVVDTEILWDKSQEMLLSRRNLPYDRDELKPKMAGGTILQGARIMIDHFNLDEDPGKMAAERLELIHGLFETGVCFVKGFPDFFQYVQSTGIKYCIATSMQKALMVKVNRKLHLDDLFGNHIYHIEDVNNVAKPNPDIFLFAARKLKTPPSHCMVIEDSPHGVEAARRAGMHVAGLATTFSSSILQKADYVALDFDGLTAYLSGIL